MVNSDYFRIYQGNTWLSRYYSLHKYIEYSTFYIIILPFDIQNIPPTYMVHSNYF